MTSTKTLKPLIDHPNERLEVEYKDWLNLQKPHGKATLAKHAIALANHGGGFIVLGFAENGPNLLSNQCPSNISVVIQDDVNNAIRKYAEPAFHCELNFVAHQSTKVDHPIISVPGTLSISVLSKRDCKQIIRQNRCYIRKPGPCSEEPTTAAEWRTLLNRCVRANREDLLDAIRSIVSGQVVAPDSNPNALEDLKEFCTVAFSDWEHLVSEIPVNAPARFPLGYYEIGMTLVGAKPAESLTELQGRLDSARRVSLSGWPLFLNLRVPGLV